MYYEREKDTQNKIKLKCMFAGTLFCIFIILFVGKEKLDTLNIDNNKVTIKQFDDVGRNTKKEGENGDKNEEWCLILVNPWNKLPKNYNVNLVDLEDGQKIDERCFRYLQNMLDDCRKEGLDPKICSSYRSAEKQESLFAQEVSEYLYQGLTASEAQKEAKKVVAYPGTSEHQLGLAVDIVDTSYQMLEEEQENTLVQKWLIKNSWKYGFILRYPTDKKKKTGIIYEPWHYRYVGKKAAKEIYKKGICLEEYLKENK